MRPLWERMLVVGAGEAEEGGFPSLTVGATELLFEPLWTASDFRTEDDIAVLDAALARAPSFARAYRRVARGLWRRDEEPDLLDGSLQ
jgi:hypothetical protein